MQTPDGALAEALGAEPAAWIPVTGGHSRAGRARVRLADGRAAFAKWATDDDTARWLRDEMRVLGAVDADFAPRVLAWRDGERPLLVLEDLGAATWPPPWTPDLARRGLDALARVAATPAPAGVPPAAALAELLRGWARVERDPAPLLALGVVDAAWLERALPALRAAEDAVSFEGDALLHNDARGDNMAFVPGGRVVLVDWNWAAVGPAALDRAYFANHVHATGGPAPEALLAAEDPDGAGDAEGAGGAGGAAGAGDARRAGGACSAWAAVIAGFYASQAGLPDLPGAPTVRAVQRAHLATALPWAARVLGL
jgi:hypothetical protein